MNEAYREKVLHRLRIVVDMAVNPVPLDPEALAIIPNPLSPEEERKMLAYTAMGEIDMVYHLGLISKAEFDEWLIKLSEAWVRKE